MLTAMHTATTMHSNIINDIKAAREAGFDGIELQNPKLFRFLEHMEPESLLPLLGDLQVTGIGAVLNIERQGDAYSTFIEEVEKMSRTAAKLGAPMIQLCTGPTNPEIAIDYAAGKIGPGDSRYIGLLGSPEEEIIEKTAKNLAAAADIAAGYGLSIYLEPIAWTPMSTLDKGVRLIEAAGRGNVGLVLDFWHMWTAGDTPEDVVKLDKKYINMVHVCDGLEYDRSQVPDQDILRDVWIGEGNIPLKAWIDAVKSTGYDGCYSVESFCRRIWEQDSLKTAVTVKNYLDFLLL